MTFVLSCVTPEYVYQVSDRRLTWLNGAQRGHVVDDERNKSVLVDGRIAFAYTGLAEIGADHTVRLKPASDNIGMRSRRTADVRRRHRHRTLQVY